MPYQRGRRAPNPNSEYHRQSFLSFGSLTAFPSVFFLFSPSSALRNSQLLLLSFSCLAVSFLLLWKFSVAHRKINSCGWRDRINQSINQLTLAVPQIVCRLLFRYKHRGPWYALFFVLFCWCLLLENMIPSSVRRMNSFPDHCFLWRLFIIVMQNVLSWCGHRGWTALFAQQNRGTFFFRLF